MMMMNLWWWTNDRHKMRCLFTFLVISLSFTPVLYSHLSISDPLVLKQMSVLHSAMSMHQWKKWRLPAVDLGPGTTATTTVYEGLCDHNYSAIHHKLHCHVNETAIDPLMFEPSRILLLVRLCLLRKKCYLENQYPIDDAERFLKEIKEAFRKAIAMALEQNIQFLLDFPYPNFASLVDEVFQKLTGESPPYFMTKRDPFSWARSRSHKHAELLCLENFDRLDIDGCIERALEKHRRSKKSSQKLSLRDVFLSVPQLHFQEVCKGEQIGCNFEFEPKQFTSHRLIEYEVADFIEGIAQGMERHQSKYEPKTFFSIDLFSAPEPFTGEQVVQLIQDSLSPKSPGTVR